MEDGKNASVSKTVDQFGHGCCCTGEKEKDVMDETFKGRDRRIEGYNLVVKEVKEDVCVGRSHATTHCGAQDL